MKKKNKTEHAAQSFAAREDYLDCSVDKKGLWDLKGQERIKRVNRLKQEGAMLSNVE